jgi:CheY-like chemotaxis protein
MSALRSETIETRAIPALSVLAVDDDPWVRLRLEEFLREAGVPFELCADPHEAFRRCAARRSAYGLVLMDIRFPAGNLVGEISRKIAALGGGSAGPAIIGMSDCANLEKFQRGTEWGMIDILPKPLFKWLIINLAHEFCGGEEVQED